MSQTVIALFNNSSDAQNAAERLMNNGFSRDNFDISLNTVNTQTATMESGNYKDTNESGVGRFFRSLFGDDNYEADKYTRVALNEVIRSVTGIRCNYRRGSTGSKYPGFIRSH